MQAQVPLDPYTGLWSRVRGFDPEAFGWELTDRRLVRMTLMRATLHVVTAADAQRLRPALQTMLERAFAASPFARELAGVEQAQIVERGIELVEREPLTVARLGAALSQEWPDRAPDALAYAVRYLAPLVQVTPRGVWGRAMQPTITTLRSWLEATDQAAAVSVDELVQRYLRAFGPATSADVRTWSGLTDLQTVVARLRPQLRSYRDEAGRELHDVADGTFADLVGGFLAGVWKLEGPARDATLVVEARTPLRASARAEVREEAERLLVFLTPRARTRRLSFASR